MSKIQKSGVVGTLFFSTRPMAGAYQLHPLAGGRVAILEERGNAMFSEHVQEGDEIDPFTLYEVLYVAMMEPEELAVVSLLETPDWRVKVRTFGLTVDDQDLQAFHEILMSEMDAIQETRTVPKKKAARKRSRK